MMKSLIDRIKTHEGFRSKPYRDTVGKLTVGYGRNLDDVGINMTEAEFLLENDLDKIIYEVNRAFAFVLSLDDNRKGVIYEMAFNMGINRFSTFKKAIAAIREKDYQRAAKEMLNSRWAEQVGQRAVTLARIMETGA